MRPAVRALVAALVLALGGVASGCAAAPAFRARLYEASPAVQSYDLLRDEVVSGRTDGLARRGGCAICRY